MDKMTCFLLMKEKQKEDKETVLKERERFKSYAIFFACTKYETKRRRTIEFSARVHSRGARLSTSRSRSFKKKRTLRARAREEPEKMVNV